MLDDWDRIQFHQDENGNYYVQFFDQDGELMLVVNSEGIQFWNDDGIQQKDSFSIDDYLAVLDSL